MLDRVALLAPQHLRTRVLHLRRGVDEVGRLVGAVSQTVVEVGTVGGNEGRDGDAREQDENPSDECDRERPLCRNPGGEPSEDHGAARGDELDQQDRQHVEGERDAQRVRGEGSRDGYDRLDAVVEEQERAQIDQDNPEPADLPERLDELGDAHRDGLPDGQPGGDVYAGRLGHHLQRPDRPPEPPHADRGYRAAGHEVGGVGVSGREVQRKVDQEEQPAADVAVGVPPAAHVVEQAARRDVREQGVVEDEASRKSYVRHDEGAHKPRPRVRRVGGKEREHHEERPSGRVHRHECLLQGGAVGDDAKDRAAQGDDRGGDRNAQAPGRAAGQLQSEEGRVLAERVLEEKDEVDGKDRGHAAGDERRVRPVVHAPPADDPPLTRRQVLDSGTQRRRPLRRVYSPRVSGQPSHSRRCTAYATGRPLHNRHSGAGRNPGMGASGWVPISSVVTVQS